MTVVCCRFSCTACTADITFSSCASVGPCAGQQQLVERQPSLPSRLAGPATTGSYSATGPLLYIRESCFLLSRSVSEHNVRQGSAPGYHMFGSRSLARSRGFKVPRGRRAWHWMWGRHLVEPMVMRLRSVRTKLDCDKIPEKFTVK